MPLPPFSATIIPEFDTVKQRPTWLVKFDGRPIARVVEVEGFLKRDAEFRVMTEGFEGACPWEVEADANGRPLPSHPTERIAIWAVIEGAVIDKEHRQALAANE